VGSTRIVLIDEGLKEHLASLFDRHENNTTAGQPRGDRVCEAHILAPNLILLDLSRAYVDQTATPRPQANDAVSEAPILKLAISKQQLGDRGTDASEPRLDPDSTISASSGGEASPISETPNNTSSPRPQEPVLQIGPVRIDRHSHWAYIADKRLHLTPTEFRLLECFLREPGRAFTRSQLSDVSIGNASFVLERTIDVHIRSLRAKLGDARDLVETVRGVGYRFRAEPG
jgi:two-component system, OmpR family, phosphate regulon response regulator PhoB